ncbi:LOW QUALITY PROTEIN: hypothetical protein PHPALM_28714 [Phytophthora palmivora]|uniref:Uncharacterized protein n=1 Tax=Phytophthora palmivora TaxID=4796 RepID=A0A2P4X9G3_9STRA|nr:LOW QUALITY PROTEIN: hypothetical protein PHPALM_28714 [Phytophthora palmivora]
MNFSATFKPNHWTRRRQSNKPVRSHSGRGSVNCCTFRNGFQQTENNIHTNSPCSVHTVGILAGTIQTQRTLPQPCSPSLVMSLGIIGDSADIELDLPQDIISLLSACTEKNPQQTLNYLAIPQEASQVPQLRLGTAPSHMGGASVLGFFFLVMRSEYSADGQRATSAKPRLEGSDSFPGQQDRSVRQWYHAKHGKIGFRTVLPRASKVISAFRPMDIQRGRAVYSNGLTTYISHGPRDGSN